MQSLTMWKVQTAWKQTNIRYKLLSPYLSNSIPKALLLYNSHNCRVTPKTTSMIFIRVDSQPQPIGEIFDFNPNICYLQSGSYVGMPALEPDWQSKDLVWNKYLPAVNSTWLLAPQSSALTIDAFKDFQPNPIPVPLIAFEHLSLSMGIWNGPSRPR